MSNYQIVFSKKASKDIKQLTDKQRQKLKQIFETILTINPYLGKPLKGELRGLYSYRLNLKDRILYEILEENKTILIIRAKTHYGE
ncbi:MAG: type II toxin-antitoxin system mRNA interferase toxin, RelE/StbE family [Crocosphaera sp.]